MFPDKGLGVSPKQSGLEADKLRILEQRVKILEGILGRDGNEIELKVGVASITLKKNGDVIIKGSRITIEGAGQVNIKSSADVVIKGQKIREN